MLAIPVKSHVYWRIYGTFCVLYFVLHRWNDHKGGNGSGQYAKSKDGSEESNTADFKFLIWPLGEVPPPRVTGRTAFLKQHATNENGVCNEEHGCDGYIGPNQCPIDVGLVGILIRFNDKWLYVGDLLGGPERWEEKSCNLTVPNTGGHVGNRDVEIVRTVEWGDISLGSNRDEEYKKEKGKFPHVL